MASCLESTKDIAPVIPYYMAIGLGGYFGYEIGGEFGGFAGAIGIGILCVNHQEKKYSDSDDDEMMPS